MRFLTGMGYNSNMPTMVVFVPKQLGGIGIQILYTTQGVWNVTQRLKHIRANSTVERLFRIDVNWLKRCTAIRDCVLARPGVEVPPTPAKYLMAIRKFLGRCRAFIIMKKKPRVLHERD